MTLSRHLKITFVVIVVLFVGLIADSGIHSLATKDWILLLMTLVTNVGVGFLNWANSTN